MYFPRIIRFFRNYTQKDHNYEKCEGTFFESDLSTFLFYIFAKSVNWEVNLEENRELGVERLHIFNSRISNSRKIPGPKKRELGGHTVARLF